MTASPPSTLSSGLEISSKVGSLIANSEKHCTCMLVNGKSVYMDVCVYNVCCVVVCKCQDCGLILCVP